MAGVFRPGDIVRLKSGGPLMTVRESYERTQTVFTNWFDGDTLMYDSFFAVELERGYLPASGLGPAPFGPPANLPFIQRADFPFVQPVPGTASGWPIGEPIPGTAAGSSVSTTGQLQKVESGPIVKDGKQVGQRQVFKYPVIFILEQ